MYLFFLISLFAEILPPSGHLCSTHSALLRCQVLLDLGFYFRVRKRKKRRHIGSTHPLVVVKSRCPEILFAV